MFLVTTKNRLKQLVKNVYEAATTKTYRSTIPGNAPQSARKDLQKSTREEIVRKSQYFEKNDPLWNRLGDLFEQYVVGAGLQYFPSSSSPEWNAKALKAWRDWCRYAEVDSRRCFEASQGLIAWRWYFDGEIFIILTRGESGKPRIQLIEAYRCKTPPSMTAKEGISIIDGVEIGANGRPVAYWFTAGDLVSQEAQYIRVEAQWVVHVFEAQRPEQRRGTPIPQPAINENHDLHDLHLLEMKAAKDAARRSTVIKNEAGEMSDEDAVRAVDEVETEDSEGNAVTENRQQTIQEATGGETLFLKPGEDIVQLTSERPSVVMQEYWRYKTSLVCSGSGIPLALAMPESINGTVIRAILDMAAAYFKTRSGNLAYLLAYVYEYVIGWEIENGTLRGAPTDWRSVTTRPPKGINVDVGRNSTALLQELEAGTRTYEDVYAELQMDSWERLRKKAIEARYIKDLAEEFDLEVAEISTLQQDRSERINAENLAAQQQMHAADVEAEGEAEKEKEKPEPQKKKKKVAK